MKTEFKNGDTVKIFLCIRKDKNRFYTVKVIGYIIEHYKFDVSIIFNRVSNIACIKIITGNQKAYNIKKNSRISIDLSCVKLVLPTKCVLLEKIIKYKKHEKV
jgi:hypothetical protein